MKRQREFSNIEARILMELDQLEDREKLVRSKFDSSVKLSADINDSGSQVVENIQTKGKTIFHLFNKKNVYIEQVSSLEFNIPELKNCMNISVLIVLLV